MKSLSYAIVHDVENVAHGRVFFVARDRVFFERNSPTALTFPKYSSEEMELFEMRLLAKKVTAWADRGLNVRMHVYDELMYIASKNKRWFE